MDEVLLDLRGLKCPLPVLRTRKALEALEAGGILSVQSTDPLAVIDISNLVRESGDQVLGITRSHEVAIIRIRKRS